MKMKNISFLLVLCFIPALCTVPVVESPHIFQHRTSLKEELINKIHQQEKLIHEALAENYILLIANLALYIKQLSDMEAQIYLHRFKQGDDMNVIEEILENIKQWPFRKLPSCKPLRELFKMHWEYVRDLHEHFPELDAFSLYPVPTHLSQEKNLPLVAWDTIADKVGLAHNSPQYDLFLHFFD